MALRTPLSVTPHLYMGDSTGRPLDMGTVYFGEQDKDPEFYPINLFSDDAMTKPLAQPVHTKGGYLYDKGDMVEPHAKEIIYSVKVLDSYGRKVFYKGAMMRNSWNDDVIEQIDKAIVGSADVARQIATDITNEAINNTAIEGGVLTDTLVIATAKANGGVARAQRSKNNDVIGVMDFGAVGDGVADDTAAVQAALTYASRHKVRLSVDGKFRLTRPLQSNTFYGFTSQSVGTIVIDFDGDVFKFASADTNATIEYTIFDYKVPTVTGSATFLFNFSYHVIGLKAQHLTLWGKKGFGWTFLKLSGFLNGGWFGGFAFSNTISFHMYCDVLYDKGAFFNSTSFDTNFKFYGTYGLWIKDGAYLGTSKINGWWGQECLDSVIRVDGKLKFTSINLVNNWDTHTPALRLSSLCSGVKVTNTYRHDVVDFGLDTQIDSNNTYISTVDTATAKSDFNFVAASNEQELSKIFPQIKKVGNLKVKSGVLGVGQPGLQLHALWVQAKPEVAAVGEDPLIPAGSYVLDTLDAVQLDTVAVGAYESFSTVRMFVDFSLVETDLDDRAFSIGMGQANNTNTPTWGTYLTVIGNRFKFVYIHTSGVVTELLDLGAITAGRHILQIIQQPKGTSASSPSIVHLNGKMVGTFTNDIGQPRRPVIYVKSVNKTTTMGILECKIRVTQSTQLKQ